ncbi:META domain-containing protein [Cellulomonas sp. IC4_254]|uniref:META domain-containing protein n=1 Tax=Cellulomonas sp. IC4_254 TaxID=2714040 RepID=UPI00141F2523|nr:META domain-containing protein [Cellulomonas sp. IC4_254]NHT17998.1 META domain-containing protein [Cellulomonas sp. IC4_254]
MDEVVGRTWRFTEVAGVPLDDGPERAHPALTFSGDGQVYGTGGVNRLRGTWSFDRDADVTRADGPDADDAPAPSTGTLTFGPMVTTLMAGTPEHMARERAVLDLLAHPVRASVRDGALVLTDGEGRVSRLLPAPAEESV